MVLFYIGLQSDASFQGQSRNVIMQNKPKQIRIIFDAQVKTAPNFFLVVPRTYTLYTVASKS